MSDLVTAEALERLRREVARHPYPLLFATVSGAHLYRFPSPDSDYDLRRVLEGNQDPNWPLPPGWAELTQSMPA